MSRKLSRRAFVMVAGAGTLAAASGLVLTRTSSCGSTAMPAAVPAETYVDRDGWMLSPADDARVVDPSLEAEAP